MALRALFRVPATLPVTLRPDSQCTRCFPLMVACGLRLTGCWSMATGAWSGCSPRVILSAWSMLVRLLVTGPTSLLTLSPKPRPIRHGYRRGSEGHHQQDTNGALCTIVRFPARLGRGLSGALPDPTAQKSGRARGRTIVHYATRLALVSCWWCLSGLLYRSLSLISTMLPS